MPHRPPLGLFGNPVQLYSLDELIETVRALEVKQPGRTAEALSAAVFAELGMKHTQRAADLVAEAIRRARSRGPARRDLSDRRHRHVGCRHVEASGVVVATRPLQHLVALGAGRPREEFLEVRETVDAAAVLGRARALTGGT
jgi:hypothetical protein